MSKVKNLPPRPPHYLAPGLDSRMTKKDFRTFLIFMGVVLASLGFAVLANV